MPPKKLSRAHSPTTPHSSQSQGAEQAGVEGGADEAHVLGLQGRSWGEQGLYPEDVEWAPHRRWLLGSLPGGIPNFRGCVIHIAHQHGLRAAPGACGAGGLLPTPANLRGSGDPSSKSPTLRLDVQSLGLNHSPRVAVVPAPLGQLWVDPGPCPELCDAPSPLKLENGPRKCDRPTPSPVAAVSAL